MHSEVEVGTPTKRCRVVRSLRDALQMTFAQPGCQSACGWSPHRILSSYWHSVRPEPPASMDGR